MVYGRGPWILFKRIADEGGFVFAVWVNYSGYLIWIDAVFFGGGYASPYILFKREFGALLRRFVFAVSVNYNYFFTISSMMLYLGVLRTVNIISFGVLISPVRMNLITDGE